MMKKVYFIEDLTGAPINFCSDSIFTQRQKNKVGEKTKEDFPFTRNDILRASGQNYGTDSLKRTKSLSWWGK